MDRWKEKRILVLGMTYPAYSYKYVENVCTGGIDERTKKMVRIHPVPLRYLKEGHRPKASSGSARRFSSTRPILARRAGALSQTRLCSRT